MSDRTPPTPPAPSLARRTSLAVQYLVLVAVAWALERLGVDRASAAMGAAWRLLAPLNSRHARADGHLAAAMPELDATERRRILGDMWENLGRTAAETILLPQLLAEPERIACDVPEEVFEKARHGAVFVSLHTGNWEIVSQPLAAHGLDLRALYKPLSNPAVERWLRERRGALYAGGLMPIHDRIALQVRTLVRTGATLAVLADQRGDAFLTLPFFGRTATANPFPALLARRLGLPLFVARTVRTEGAHFRIEGHWLDVPKTADVQADVAALTGSIHAVFEAWIRELPSQWMWAHRKWL